MPDLTFEFPAYVHVKAVSEAAAVGKLHQWQAYGGDCVTVHVESDDPPLDVTDELDDDPGGDASDDEVEARGMG